MLTLQTIQRGDEDIIERTPCYTEINVIRGYVPARRSVVTVVDAAGRPVLLETDEDLKRVLAQL